LEILFLVFQIEGLAQIVTVYAWILQEEG
jgi:hypothetical protein